MWTRASSGVGKSATSKLGTADAKTKCARTCINNIPALEMHTPGVVGVDITMELPDLVLSLIYV